MIKKPGTALLFFLTICAAASGISNNSTDLQKASELTKNGRLQEAVNVLTPLSRDRAYILGDYAQLKLAQIFETSGDKAQTEIEYLKLALNFPESLLSGKANYKLGELCINRGDYQKASEYFQKVIDSKVTNIPKDLARYRQAICYERMGLSKKAAAGYFDIAMLHPMSPYVNEARQRIQALGSGYPVPGPDTLYRKAKVLFENGDYSRAASSYSAFSGLFPADKRAKEAVLQQGICHYLGGDYRTAEKILLTCRNSYAKAGYYLVSLSLRRDRIPEALLYFKELVLSFPDNEWGAEAEYKIARYYRWLGDKATVKLIFSDLIDRYPRSAAAGYAVWDKGFDLYRAGQISEAYETFRRISITKAEDKVFSKCLLWYAKCAEKLGKREEARRALEKSAKEFPHTYYGMRASERLGMDPQKAAANKEEPYTFLEFQDKLRIDKCRELMSAGLLDEALVEAKELSVNGSDDSVRSKGKAYMALILTGQQRYKSAINLIEEEFDRDPGSAKDKEAQMTAMSILYPTGFEGQVKYFSQKYGVDPYLMFALIREESRFNPMAISRSKARGLTQIMPRTGKLIARGLKIKPYWTTRLFDPDLNVKMGTYYLSCMLDLFDGNKYLALASYNGGSGHVSRWLKKQNFSDIDDFVENIPLKETRLYVQKVLESYWHYKRIYGGG